MTFFRLLLASSFVVGAATAQQGLVVQPWSKPVVAKPVLPETSHRAQAPTLPPARAALPAPRTVDPAPTSPPTSPAEGEWTPPVVALLVDPWAKPSQLATAPRPRWVPESSDIIDPWANEPVAEPRVAASRPADAPRDTIF
ncbi:MAG TPA: hypothetical protein VHB79_33935 [Polyangiaceae bacterium]|nr:hypothetical protein [Polyangiaceae bacterium]